MNRSSEVSRLLGVSSPLKTWEYEAVTDAYLARFEDGTRKRADRHDERLTMMVGMAVHRPQSVARLVSVDPGSKPSRKLKITQKMRHARETRQLSTTPVVKVASQTSVISKFGWGGGANRPILRKLAA